ncbi:MAG: DUF2784 domain-containing protein [Planctomycetota bacterium]
MDTQAWSSLGFRVAADAVLVVHVAVVLFVILGLMATLVGGFLGWRWVTNRWFRGLHLLAILQIAGQALGGITCPLTSWETQLRIAGGQRGYEDFSFVGYWLSRVLFFDAPTWVFTSAYVTFAALVIGALWFVPVRWRGEPRVNLPVKPSGD